jgi:hypothetical protein
VINNVNVSFAGTLTDRVICGVDVKLNPTVCWPAEREYETLLFETIFIRMTTPRANCPSMNIQMSYVKELEHVPGSSFTVNVPTCGFSGSVGGSHANSAKTAARPSAERATGFISGASLSGVQ